jgi:hypothetical protein
VMLHQDIYSSEHGGARRSWNALSAVLSSRPGSRRGAGLARRMPRLMRETMAPTLLFRLLGRTYIHLNFFQICNL